MLEKHPSLSTNNLTSSSAQLLAASSTQVPRAYPLSPWQAVYRLQPEDFQVTEVLGFEPEGQGEHVFVWIEKTNSSTAQVAQELARLVGIHPKLVAFSGLKDRYAVTQQWFSLHLPGQPDPDLAKLRSAPAANSNSAHWQALKLLRHPRKLKRGTHQANHFQLRLHLPEANASTAAWLEQRWHMLVQQGVPNYFGPQRFGIGASNTQQGLNWLLAEHPVKPPSRSSKSLYLSAVRSALFNAWLAQSLHEQTWQQPAPGSCYNLAGTRSFFGSTADENLSHRLATGDVHPAGPLAGRGEFSSQTTALQAEEQFRRKHQAVWQALANQGLRLEYLSARVIPAAAQLTWQQPWLHLSFSLPRGSFATSILRELVLAQDAQLQTPSHA